MNTTPPPRLLKPVTDTIRHDAAPFIRLSPTKSMKNASIIYEAIKDMPDRTLIRADFDKRGIPLVYFPERPSKKVEIKSPIKAKNIDADRKEMASFLASIVDVAYRSADPNTKLINAAKDLKLRTNGVREQGGDFTVGDIKKSLHTMAIAYRLQNIQKLTSPHRLLAKQDSQIQRKRFKEFIQLDRQMFTRLSDAIRDPSGSKYDTTAEVAVYEMKQMLRSYRILRLTETVTFVEFLRRKGIGSNLHFFVTRWLEISFPTATASRIQLATEPWAKEMDKICPLIEKEFRRRARVVGSHQPSKYAQDRLVYPKSPLPSIPPLPPTPAKVSPADQATVSPADQLGPMSPKQLVMSESLEASIHHVPLSPEDRRLFIPTIQLNLSPRHPDTDWLENAASDDLNRLYTEATESSQSDLLSRAFSPPGHALGPGRAAPTEILSIAPILPYRPIVIYQAETLSQTDEIIRSDTTMSATETEIPLSSQPSVLGLDSQMGQTPGNEKPGPSLMMLYPKQGYSPLDDSTTRDEY